MRRRSLILSLLAVAATGGARAEQSRKAHRIAIVHPTHPSEAFILAFSNEPRRLGYVEGDNLLIERYSGEGRASHYPDLARDVVSRNPELIVAITTRLVLDFKAATTTIPIVGVFAAPIENGIVPSLARPGGNITGASVDVGQEQWGKRIQLLQQVVPQATRLGVLESRAVRERWSAFQRELDRRMGITRVGPPLDHPIDEDGYRRVFAALAQDRAEAIMVNDEAENLTNLRLIVELAEKARLAAIYPFKMYVEAGGLMSYGIDIPAVGHNVADMVSQIMKGGKPPDIPIFQPTKFELAINLKTAKALGLTVPPELLATADEVIE
jgi:putative tryptophan/tyrosine transport system substrate-binding protein